jgi:hypothetical protein
MINTSAPNSNDPYPKEFKMFLSPKSPFVSFSLIAGFCLAAPLAYADNGSPAQTPSDTTGFNFAPEIPKFVPGKVETHRAEIGASAGAMLKNGDVNSGSTFQGHARVLLITEACCWIRA